MNLLKLAVPFNSSISNHVTAGIACNNSVLSLQARQKLQSELRNLQTDIDSLREQIEEEQESKADLLRQLSRANAEAQQWRTKYESEGMARAEELEDAKRKLQVLHRWLMGSRIYMLTLFNKEMTYFNVVIPRYNKSTAE